MIKYFSLLVLVASFSFAANANTQCRYYPKLPNITHFFVEEAYDGQSDTTQIHLGPDIRFGLSCVLDSSEKDGSAAYVGFNDLQSNFYEASPDPRQSSASTILKYSVAFACAQPDGGAYMIKQGYFDAIPQKDSVTGQMIDYDIDDGSVRARVLAVENLDDSVTFRDLNRHVVAVARLTGIMVWEIENPGKLSQAHIGLVLTHKRNKKNQCFGPQVGNNNGNNNGNNGIGGLGFWPSIGVAVGVTAATTALIAGAIALACKVCKKRTQQPHQPYQPLNREMLENV